MARNKKKANRNLRPQQSGGDGSNLQPAGTPSGLVRRPQNAKQRKKALQQQQGRKLSHAQRSKLAKQQGSELPGKVVDAVREEGFLRHSEAVRAHADAVMAIVMAEDAVYSCSRDKQLKRWRVQKSPGGGRLGGLFELKAEVEVPLGDVCWSMMSVGEWLFCGLGDGTIRGFAKSGGDATLFAHNKRVSALLAHQHVILSGAADNTVRCWQVDPASQNFACTHTISEGIPGAVQCLSVLNEHLWVGGTSGIAIVELATLRVVSQLLPKKFIAGFLQFEGHMIVAYADGAVRIFDAAGTEKRHQAALPAGTALAIGGLEVGPRLLIAHAKGQVSSIELPAFEYKLHWQAFQKCKVQCVCCTGSNGIFLLGAENGNIQIWQRDDVSEL